MCSLEHRSLRRPSHLGVELFNLLEVGKTDALGSALGEAPRNNPGQVVALDEVISRKRQDGDAFARARLKQALVDEHSDGLANRCGADLEFGGNVLQPHPLARAETAREDHVPEVLLHEGRGLLAPPTVASVRS